MRSALIIGASGQDGRLLAPFLSKRAYSVRGWVRQEPATSLSCEYSVTDILQRETVRRGAATSRLTRFTIWLRFTIRPKL